MIFSTLKTPPANPKAKRWGSVALAALLGVGICVFLSPVLDKCADSLASYFERFELVPIYILGVIALILVGHKLSDLGVLRIGQFSNRVFLSFPPIWLAGALGSAGYVGIRTLGVSRETENFTSISIGFIASYWLVTVVSITVGAFMQRWLSSQGPDVRNTGREASAEPNLKFKLDEEARKFVDWFQNEAPITSLEQDLYDRGPIALRIARRLQEDRFQTVGLTGEYGCGKSSIVELTRRFLKETGNDNGQARMERAGRFVRVIECQIGTWGISRENIAQYILSRMIETLSDHVDTTALRLIPSQYIAALNSFGSNWLDSIIKLVSSPSDPLEVLRKIDGVLRCIDYRLVVFIEDVDRNIDDNLVKVELFALLDRLKTMENISFVVAIGNESALLQYLIRVLEHIEPIRSLQLNESRETLIKFRRLAKNVVKDRCISIYSEDSADTRLGLSEIQDAVFFFLGAGERTPLTHMAALLDTPRLQKLVLRRSWSAWHSLCGEVDFDELLVICILQHSVPTVFAFVNDNLNEIRIANGDAKRQKILNPKLDELFTSTGWRGIHVRGLIKFLFPGVFVEGGRSSRILPQRVAEPFVNDYWVRIAREELQGNDRPYDQEVLDSFCMWKENSNSIVFEDKSITDALIDTPRFAKQIRCLGIGLDIEEILSLSSHLFAKLVERNYEPKPGCDPTEEYPGLVELKDLYYSKHSETPFEWLIHELSVALRFNLRMSNRIYYFWGFNGSRGQGYEEYVAAANSTYSENLQVFVDALSQEHPYTLFHFCVLFSDTKYGGPGFDSIDWKWLGSVLLRAIKISPAIIVPELLVLLTDPLQDQERVRFYRFSHERAKAILGQRYKNKLKSLQQMSEQLNLPPEIEGRLTALRGL